MYTKVLFYIDHFKCFNIAMMTKLCCNDCNEWTTSVVQWIVLARIMKCHRTKMSVQCDHCPGRARTRGSTHLQARPADCSAGVVQVRWWRHPPPAASSHSAVVLLLTSPLLGGAQSPAAVVPNHTHAATTPATAATTAAAALETEAGQWAAAQWHRVCIVTGLWRQPRGQNKNKCDKLLVPDCDWNDRISR